MKFWKTTTDEKKETIDLRALASRYRELGPRRQQFVGQRDSRRVPLLKAEAETQAKHDTAAAKLLEFDREQARELGVIDAEISRIETLLIRSAPAMIDEARAAIWNRYNAERSQLRVAYEQPTGKFNGRTLAPEMRTVANEGAITRLLTKTKNASAALDALKLDGLTGAELESSIERILEPVERAWDSIGELDPIDPVAA